LSRSRRNERGELEVSPSVACDLADSGLLLMRDDPPGDCPFRLEHVLAMQDADPEFADWMSGRRVEDEAVF